MQPVQDREAARLRHGLEDAFRSIFEAFTGRPLGPDLGFLPRGAPQGTGSSLEQRRLGLTQEGRVAGMVTTPGEFVPAVAPSGPRLETSPRAR